MDRFVLALILVAACTTPDVAPAVDVAAPMAAQPDASVADAVTPDPPAKPTASPAVDPQPAVDPEVPPTPVGTPLQLTHERKGLRFITTAQLERTLDTLDLVLTTDLHNTTTKPQKVALHPPRITVQPTAIPGPAGEGYIGLGIRGEGWGSDICTGHGGPAILPPGEHRAMHRRVDLDPMPWEAGQAYRVTATSRDCRPGHRDIDVVDVIVIPPATPDGVPTLAPAEPTKPK